MDKPLAGTSIAMGLDAIFSIDKNEDNKAKIQPIILSQIQSSPYQARKNFSESAIQELAASISQHGLLQPIILRRLQQKNEYELLAGERRVRAMRSLNRETIAAIVCDADDVTAMAFGLIENIQRQNLNAIEEAEAYERLLNEFQLSHDALAEKMGKSRSHITNLLRLHRLPDAVKKYLISETISMGHARAILSLPVERQVEMAEWIIHRGMSVRQTEEFVKRVFANTVNATENKPIVITPELKNDIEMWQKKLNEKYETGIKIVVNAEGRGRVILEAESIEVLSHLVKKLMC